MAYKDKNDPRYKEARLRHYRANKEAYLGRNKQNRLRNIAIAAAEKDRPCVDCGNQYASYNMHFDHITGDKILDISAMARRGVGEKKLREEIAKCEVVCALCHGDRTHVRRQADIV